MILSAHITSFPTHPYGWTLAAQKQALKITTDARDAEITARATAAYLALENYSGWYYGDHGVQLIIQTPKRLDDEPRQLLGEAFGIHNTLALGSVEILETVIVPAIGNRAQGYQTRYTPATQINPIPSLLDFSLDTRIFELDRVYRIPGTIGILGNGASLPNMIEALNVYLAWIIDTDGDTGWNGILRSGAAEILSTSFGKRA